MDEIFGFVPGGPWLLGAVALLAIPGVRRNLRPLAKNTMKVGLAVTDQLKGLTAETREQMNDLYEEAKAEYADTRTGQDGSDGAGGARRGSPRPRRPEAAEPAS